jgi:hypothetical protein
LNPEIRAQQFKWAQPTKVEAKPSDPGLGFGTKAEPFENLVLTEVGGRRTEGRRFGMLEHWKWT